MNETTSSSRWAAFFRTPAAGLAGVLILTLPWLRNPWMAHPGYFRAAIVQAAAAVLVLLLTRQWMKSGVAISLPVEKNKPGAMTARGLWCLALYFLWCAVSFLWTESVFLTGTRLHLLGPAIVLTLGIVLAVRGREQAKRLFLLSVFSGAACAGGALIAVAGGWTLTHPTGRYQWPYMHPAALGGSLVFPATALGLWTLRELGRKRLRQAICAAVPFALCLAALMASQTRSNLLGVGAGLWLGWILLFQGRLRKVALALGLIAVVTGTVYLAESFDTKEKRESIYTSTFGTRVLFGASALRMAAAKPVTGWGAGAFVRVMPSFERKEDFLHGQRGDIVYTAHSEPLEILAESGIIGLLLVIGAAGWILLGAIRAGKGMDKPWPLYAACGLTGMLVDACGSMSLRYPELPWHLSITFGITAAAGLYGYESGGVPATADKTAVGIMPEKRRLLFHVACVAAVAYAVFGIWPTAQAQVLLLRATTKYKSWSASLNALRQAEASAFEFLTWFRIAEERAYQAEKSGLFEESLSARKRVLHYSPGGLVNRMRQANLLYRLGRGEEALAAAVSGLRLNPYHPGLETELRRILSGCDIGDIRRWTLRLSPVPSADDQAYLEWRCAWEAGWKKDAYKGLLQTEEISLGNRNYILSRWARSLGHNEEALAWVAPLLEHYPSDPRALAMGADLLVTIGGTQSIDRAYELIDRAVRLGRALPEVVGVASPLYLAGRDYARAESVVRGALSENPDSPLLWIEQIKMLQRLGKTEEAEKALRAALRRFPREPAIQRLAPRRDKKTPAQEPRAGESE